MLALDDTAAQVAAVEQFFGILSAQMDRIPPPAHTATPTIHTGEMV